jgi:hypothetical protein
MMRKIKPATIKIVAQALSDIQGKFKLGCFGKSLPQAGVVCGGLLANRTHHRGKLALSSLKSLRIDAVVIPSSAQSMCGSATCL